MTLDQGDLRRLETDVATRVLTDFQTRMPSTLGGV